MLVQTLLDKMALPFMQNLSAKHVRLCPTERESFFWSPLTGSETPSSSTWQGVGIGGA